MKANNTIIINLKPDILILPVPLSDTPVSSIKHTDDRANLLRNSSIIVVYEASMAPVHTVHCINHYFS